MSSIEETERFAEKLCRTLENALKAVDKRLNKKSRKSAPWWTSECKSAHLDYREALDEPDRLTRTRTFRATVASAKREHWTRKIEDMKSSQDVFRLMRWAAPQNTNITPPLRHEGKFISDHTERALVLRDSLFARFSAADDLPPCILLGEERIPWSEELTELEVRACTIGSGNTSPGADGISVELLSACWNHIKSHVVQLF